jgi:ABC-type xylose transport system substrate-binding protein
MATLSKALFRGAATTTVGTTLYTVPSSTTTVVTDIVVTNTAASNGTFTLALAGTNLATTVAVAANDSTVISLKQVLATTNTITGGASAVTINFHISGIELS